MPLVLPPERVVELAAILSPEELTRSSRLLSDILRRRFIVARATLRNILAHYADCPPTELVFSYSPRGKPSLAAKPNLHFNLAHSDDLALIAVTMLGPVGVDIERLRAVPNAMEIARRFFSSRESAALESFPSNMQTAAFFNLWTHKEAWVKATGEGIGESLSQIEVSFQPGEPARILSLPVKTDTRNVWTLHTLAPAPGFVGALAIATQNSFVQCWRWVG